MTQDDVTKFEEAVDEAWKKYGDSDTKVVVIINHVDQSALSFFGNACVVCTNLLIAQGVLEGYIKHMNSENDEDDVKQEIKH